jgi:hypothetical protein
VSGFTRLFGVADVRRVLIFAGYPAVADQEATDVPLIIVAFLVAVHHCFCDVRDVLTSIRFASNVYLCRGLGTIQAHIEARRLTSSRACSGKMANHFSKNIVIWFAISSRS